MAISIVIMHAREAGMMIKWGLNMNGLDASQCIMKNVDCVISRIHTIAIGTMIPLRL